MDSAKFEELRDELRRAFAEAESKGNPQAMQEIQSLFDRLTPLQEQMALDDLNKRAAALNELSSRLNGTIQTIQTQIGNFLLTKLNSLKQEVDTAVDELPANTGGDGGGGGGGAGGTPPAGPGAGSGPAAGGTPPVAGASSIAVDLAALMVPHRRFANSVTWHLTSTGLSISGNAPQGTGGQPQTVTRIWNDFGPAIEQSAAEFGVPVELIIATICTESRGDPKAIRFEPGYVSDDATPGRVSPGLMQTLISTARDTLPGSAIDRHWLFVPANSIRAGTAYISKQSGSTKLDPPVVACAYNAGSVKENTGADNRWKMRQFPIGTSEHANRFVQWFNDCFLVFAPPASAPAASFYRLLN